MAEPLTVAVGAVALCAASWAAWLQVPRPPSLDGERLFKTALVTLLRGQVEQDTREVADWEAAVRRFVPYHPAGRLPEAKLLNPAAVHLPGARLEGEQALLDALGAIPDLPARYARMYEEDEAAFEVLMADPIELGPAYDPAAHCSGLGWDEVAAMGGGAVDGLVAARQKLGAEWVWVASPDCFGPSLAPAFATVVGGLAVEPAEVDEDATLAEALRGRIEARDDRLVLVSEGSGVLRVLRMLHANSDLRDHVAAVVSVGGLLAGLPA